MGTPNERKSLKGTKGKAAASKPAVSDVPWDRNLLSVRGYSAWRRNRGLPSALATIMEAIQSGRISRTCPAHLRCPVGCRKGKLDPEHADAEWMAATDPCRQRTHQQPEALAQAREMAAYWRGRNERIKYEQAVSTLVEGARVKAAIYRTVRAVCEAILMVPRRVAPRLELPPLERKRVEAEMSKELRETLKRLDRVLHD